MPETSKRIALFISSFRAGGGERVMVDIANQIVKRGYTVDLLALKPIGPYENHVQSTVNVISLDAGRIIFSLPKLIKYLRSTRPHAALALDEYTHLLLLLARMLSFVETKTVLRISNIYSILHERHRTTGNLSGRLIPMLSRILYPRADAFIANSHGVAKDIENVFGISRNCITVIGNPKNLGKLDQLCAEPVDHSWFTGDTTLPVIVWFGRVRTQKDLPTLIKAFAQLQHTHPSRLMFIGDGRERKQIEACITEMGVEECVELLGYVDNPHKYAARADVYVLSSLWEGLPNALIEAMACGVAVVATDCDAGPREILAPDSNIFLRRTEGVEWGPYGALIPVGGVHELTEAISRLLSDNDLRSDYAQKARERAQAFDADIILDAYIDVLLSNKS